MSAVAVIAVLAGSVVSAQQQPAIRPLGPVIATSGEAFGPVVTLRHLKNGVLVNDVANRRVLLLDKDLANPSVVADTTSATGTAYAGRVAGLLPYRGDSTLFVDPQSLSMLVIDPSGKLTSKVMSVPRSQDAQFMAAPANSTMDNAGRVIYRGLPAFQFNRPAQSANGSPVFTPPEIPDSTVVLRVNVATRALDTIGFVKIPKVKMDVQNNEGRISMRSMVNPLPTVDDFAVLSDGSVAIVRGRDFHIDWIRPDGKRESTAKIPFDWKRLSDEDKVAFIDSVKAYREKLGANAPVPGGFGGGPNIQIGFGGGGGGGAGRGGDGGRQVVVGGDAQPPRRGADGGADGGRGGPGGPGAFGQQQLLFVPADELPDYQPVFFANSARADADGMLWIRTIATKAVPGGGTVYDVINSSGELVDRVAVPADRTIIGFGPAGVVYLRVGASNKIEKASAK